MPNARRNTLLVGGLAAALVAVLLVVFLSGGPGTAPGDAAAADDQRNAPAQVADGAESASLGESAAESGESPGGDPAPSGASASGAVPVPAPASDTADDEITGPRWEGTVVSAETGEPIEGARLMVLENIQPVARASVPAVAYRAETDEDGRFVVRAQASSQLGVIERLRVEADGHASMIHILPAAKRPDDRKVVFRLPGGGAIAGTVTDGALAPVPNALVGFLILDDFSAMDMMRGDAMTVASAYTMTDATGAFRLDGLRAGTDVRLPVRANGFLPHRTGGIATGTEGVRIVLERGTASIEGLVLDADGEPFPGAYATLTSTGAQRMAMIGSVVDMIAATSETVADMDGRFTFDGLGPGGYDLLVSGQDRPVGMGMSGKIVRKGVSLREDQVLDVTIQFPEPIVITGRAVVKGTEQGVAGVRVGTEPYRAFPMMGGMTPADTGAPRANEIVTGSDGAFELEIDILDAGMMKMAMYYYDPPEGWVAEVDVGPMGQNMPGMGMLMSPAAGSTQEVLIELTEGVRRSGVVYEPDGATPAAGASLQLAQGPGMGETSSTGEDGRFTFYGSPGDRMNMTVEHDAGFGSAEIVFDEAKTPEDIVVTLEAGGSISGHVVDSRDKAVAGADVFFENPRRGLFAPPDMDSLFGTKTDAEGYFFREGLKAGEYRLRAEPPDDTGLATGRSEVLTLSAGDNVRDAEIVLEGGVFIDGLVYDARTTEPIPGIQVTGVINAGEARMPEMTETDAEGYFRIEGVAEGERLQVLSFNADGYEAQTRTAVSFEDCPLTIELEPFRTFEVEAYRMGSGQAVTRYIVHAEAASGQFNPMTFMYNAGENRVIDDPNGRGTIERVGGGEQRIRVAELEGDTPTGGYGSIVVDTATLDDRELIRVPVQPGRSVEGVVVLADSGEGVPGAEVALTLQGMPQLPPMFQNQNSAFDVPAVTTGGDGSFVFPSVPEGNWQAQASAEDLYHKNGWTRFSTTADGEAPYLRIELEHAGVLSGTVTGVDGLPAAGVRIHAHPPGATQPIVTNTDDAGFYYYESIQPGMASVIAIIDGETQQGEQVEILSGEGAVLDLDFSGQIRLSGRVQTQPGAGFLPNMTVLISSDGDHFSLNPAGGSYRTTVPPGIYTATLFGGTGSHQPGPTIEVLPEPSEQVIDIVLDYLPVSLRFDMPEGGDAPLGPVTIVGEDGWSMTVPSNASQGGYGQGLFLLPGRYSAAYTSGDGAWEGASVATPIAPGAQNVLTLLVAEVEQ